ncbi:hypothetical protein PybrP1_013072, partial [[Pythium] brassicae (nom. inval.)]
IARFAGRLNIESYLLMIYPTYSVAFVALSSWNLLAFVFVLPVVKFVLKKIVQCVVADLEDLVPAVVITIDLFNALYQSKGMQSSGSLLTTVGVIGIDLVQNVVALRELFLSMRVMEALTSGELVANGFLVYAMTLVSALTQLSRLELCQRKINGKESSAAEAGMEGERLLLVEYVESAIPLLYTLYLAILYQLPNAKYYPESPIWDQRGWQARS